MIFFFGSELEAVFGALGFASYFFFCSIFAGALYVGTVAAGWVPGAMSIPMVGASASIYGLWLAYGVLFGERTILFMMLFPLPAKVFVGALALIEAMNLLFSRSEGPASIAHLGGMLGGGLFGVLWLVGRVYTRNRQQRGVRGSGRSSGKGRWPGAGRFQKKRPATHLRLVRTSEQQFDAGPDDEEGSSSDSKTWH
jgi:membrane associated rhomboid family serine protease